MHSTKWLSIILVLLCFVLLVGNRLGASFAGGTPVHEHETVTTPGGRAYERGEIVFWQDTDQFQIGSTTVFLDENTEVKIVNSIPGEETINVIQGRVVVKGDVTIEVRELDFQVSGTTSFVHYSWLNEIDVMNIDGSVAIDIDGAQETVEPNTSAHLSTLPPYELTKTTLDLNTSYAAAFYERVLLAE